MNAIEYKRIMKERGLIESPLSVSRIADAMVIQQNIRTVKRWDDFSKSVMEFYKIDIDQLLKEYEEKKKEKILEAIHFAWDEKETIERLGNVYYTQLEILKKTEVSHISRCTERFERQCEL